MAFSYHNELIKLNFGGTEMRPETTNSKRTHAANISHMKSGICLAKQRQNEVNMAEDTNEDQQIHEERLHQFPFA